MRPKPGPGGTAAIYGLMLLTAMAWGGTFVAGRLVARESGPLYAALWRFILAALILVPLTRLREGRLTPAAATPGDWLRLALLGAAGVFGYNYFFIKGLGRTEVGLAAIIVSANPGLTYLGLAVFFGERPTRRGLAGFALALAGAALAITKGRPAFSPEWSRDSGEILLAACALCWSAYSLLGKRVLQKIPPLMAVNWACLFGLAYLAPAALLESGPWAFLDYSPTGWASLAFLGFFGAALGFTVYYYGIQRLGAGRAAVFINLTPIFALLSGRLILGESLDWSLAAGLLLVLSGIRLIQKA